MTTRIARPAGIALAGVVVLAVAMALAGCGAPTTSGATLGGGTPQTPQQCGTIHGGGPGPVAATAAPGSDQQALDCFWHAHTACMPATLVYTVSGVDATTTHTFSVVPGASGCSVADQVHTWVNTKTNDFGPLTCLGIRQVGSGLEIDGCGSFGDVAINPSSG